MYLGSKIKLCANDNVGVKAHMAGHGRAPIALGISFVFCK